jgi:hypothetical protein
VLSRLVGALERQGRPPLQGLGTNETVVLGDFSPFPPEKERVKRISESASAAAKRLEEGRCQGVVGGGRNGLDMVVSLYLSI